MFCSEMKLEDIQCQGRSVETRLVRIVKSVRQVVGSQRPPWKAVTASVPNRELVGLKAECDKQCETQAVQVEEQYKPPSPRSPP